MRPLPPGWPEVIPGLPLLFVLIGAPECFSHAQSQKSQGFFNHVALASAGQVPEYQWPTAGLMLVVILFLRYECQVEKEMVATLLADEPKELSVRYWPGQQVIECTP